jgi:predicted HAD superfamily phosphohydrolase YqeG
MKMYNYKPSELVLIGDQLVNDVYASNRLEITSILVNPMSEKDFFTSFLNRIFEKFVFNFLNRKELFIRGKYYE